MPEFGFSAPGPYRTIMLGSLLMGFILWGFRVRKDRRMLGIYLGGVLGGLSGAKIVYLLAEGWLYFGEPDVWMHLLAGKTIVGALLGGYLGIEVAKSMVGYREPTGDWFAFVVPVGIGLGRVGCLTAGCCLGIPLAEGTWCAVADARGTARWPSSQAELGFNVLMVILLGTLYRGKALKGQLFHVYLISYGVFRFSHEFLRATEKPFGGLSGYQIAAAGLVLLGVLRFRQRQVRMEGSTRLERLVS